MTRLPNIKLCIGFLFLFATEATQVGGKTNTLKMVMKARKFLSIILGVFTMLAGCRRDESCLTCPPNELGIFLDTLIVDPTEVWLRMHTNDSISLGVIQLYRDGVPIRAATIPSMDTTIVDTGLAPASLHRYRAYRIRSGHRVDSTSGLVLKMMDTTRHDFIWHVDTLGEGNGSCLLYTSPSPRD